MSTEEDLGKEDSTSSDRVAYIMRSIRYNQKTTNEFESGENTREKELCARGWNQYIHISLFVY